MWLLTNGVKCVKHTWVQRSVMLSTPYKLTEHDLFCVTGLLKFLVLFLVKMYEKC